MFTLVQLVGFLVVIQGTQSLRCYGLVSSTNGSMVLGNLGSTAFGLGCNDTTMCVCTSYQAQCSDKDMACTPREIQMKTIKWFHTIVSQDTCANMTKISSKYMNVTCCNTYMCNNQGLDQLLQCYATVPDSNNGTMIATWNGILEGIDCDGLGGCVCASYRAKCALYMLTCTVSEAQAGIVKWIYRVMSKSLCTTMMSTPAQYMDLTCCDTDMCNNQSTFNAASIVVHSFSAWTALLILYITFKETRFF